MPSVLSPPTPLPSSFWAFLIEHYGIGPNTGHAGDTVMLSHSPLC